MGFNSVWPNAATEILVSTGQGNGSWVGVGDFSKVVATFKTMRAGPLIYLWPPPGMSE